MRDHVVATDLGSVLNPLENILCGPYSVVHEELLDPSCIVLVVDGFARKETDRAELVAHDECFAVTREFAVQRVVSHVPID